MNNQSCNIRKKRIVQSVFVLSVFILIVLLIFVIDGCVTAPKLTPEDRKRDIQFLADWARDYSPLAELNPTFAVRR